MLACRSIECSLRSFIYGHTPFNRLCSISSRSISLWNYESLSSSAQWRVSTDMVYLWDTWSRILPRSTPVHWNISSHSKVYQGVNWKFYMSVDRNLQSKGFHLIDCYRFIDRLVSQKHSRNSIVNYCTVTEKSDNPLKIQMKECSNISQQLKVEKAIKRRRTWCCKKAIKRHRKSVKGDCQRSISCHKTVWCCKEVISFM